MRHSNFDTDLYLNPVFGKKEAMSQDYFNQQANEIYFLSLRHSANKIYKGIKA